MTIMAGMIMAGTLMAGTIMAEEIKVAALVPAAGSSRRMGTDKRRLAHPQGGVVIEVTVKTLRQAGLDPVVVVLEPDSPCAGLAGLANTIQVVNPTPELGMLSSIAAGLAALPPEIAAVAVQPGDHVFAPAWAMARQLQRFIEQRPPLLIPRYAERRGHPLWIARELFAEAAACDHNVGLRQLVHRHGDRALEMPFELPDADADLDRPEDLARLQQLGHRDKNNNG